jgi:methionyl aminopeptidase
LFFLKNNNNYNNNTIGSNKYLLWPDKWTAATIDGLPTAQFEHTLLITEFGVEELTGKLENSPKYSWEI